MPAPERHLVRVDVSPRRTSPTIGTSHLEMPYRSALLHPDR